MIFLGILYRTEHPTTEQQAAQARLWERVSSEARS